MTSKLVNKNEYVEHFLRGYCTLEKLKYGELCNRERASKPHISFFIAYNIIWDRKQRPLENFEKWTKMNKNEQKWTKNAQNSN